VRGLEVEMPDGVVLLADRWFPRGMTEPLPTILMRCPYGRGGTNVPLFRPFAERGFQVVVQSVRGTFGSGGAFEPFRNERRDGLATIDWITREPGFDGNLVLAGASYLGYVQWAVCDRLPSCVRAIIPMVTSSNLVEAFHRPESLFLGLSRRWGYLIARQERGELHKLPAFLPRFDRRDVPGPTFLEELAAHHSEDDHWRACDVNHRHRVRNVTAPVSLITGWQDILLTAQLADYRELVEAGRQPRLVIGPWAHTVNSMEYTGAAVREALEWVAGAEPRRRPVRLFITGLGAWRSFEAWPPAGYAPTSLHLQPGGGLAETLPPQAAEPDRYRMNLAKPTPHLGGPGIDIGAGTRNQRSRERRPDVLTYTSSPIESMLDAVGEPSAEIWVRSTRPDGMLVVTVCDVDHRGVSRNVTEGVAQLATAPSDDGLYRVRIPLRAIGHQFLTGHRIRVQVASAAYPQYWSLDAPPSGWTDQEIFHDRDRPSAIVLPDRIRAVRPPQRSIEPTHQEVYQ
jgi:hypothetical protein